MKINDIVAMMAVVLTAGGCTSNDEGTQPDQTVPIRLAATISVADVGQARSADGAKTRAFGDWGGSATTQDTELLKDETVRAWISENETGHTAAIKNPIEYKVADPSTADAPGDLEPVNTTTDPPFYYPIGVDNISIHAIHPSGYASGDKFTVNLDQTTETSYAASDLCYSMPTNFSRTDVDANGRKLLQMKHLLSKIVVNLTLDANVTGATLPTSIKLRANTSTTMTYPVAVTTDANGYTGCTPSDASDPGVITMKQEAIIPPQTIAAGASFISFSVTGLGPMIYPMPDATTFESGKRYTYNIRVKNVGIAVTTDVTDWGTKTDGGTLIGKSQNYRKNPLWYVAEYNLNSDLTFNTTAGTSQGYLFQWNTGTYSVMNLGFTANTTGYDGYALPNPAKTVSNGEIGVTWHVPTAMEFYSILPSDYTASKYIFTSNSTYGIAPATIISEFPCTFGYNNDTKYGVGNTSNPVTPTGTSYNSYWSTYTTNSWVRYAIRFLGTDYCSVWKYHYVDYNTGTCRLVISSKLINKNDVETTSQMAAKITEITNGSYDWTEQAGCIVRNFYACGFCQNAQQNSPGQTRPNSEGNFWSTTKSSSNASNSIFMRVYTENTSGVGNGTYVGPVGTSHGFSIRLFRDN